MCECLLESTVRNDETTNLLQNWVCYVRETKVVVNTLKIKVTNGSIDGSFGGVETVPNDAENWKM